MASADGCGSPPRTARLPAQRGGAILIAGPLAAAALLVTLPVLLLTVVAQRQIVAGLSAGGLKDG